jgi:hypothetical protein
MVAGIAVSRAAVRDRSVPTPKVHFEKQAHLCVGFFSALTDPIAVIETRHYANTARGHLSDEIYPLPLSSNSRSIYQTFE